VKNEKTLQTMGVSGSQRTPIRAVTVRNRGRRDAKIQNLLQAKNRNVSNVFGDLMLQLPFPTPAEETVDLVMGKDGGYGHGDVKLKRFYAVDGANRIHPLRERYRQRLARPFRRRSSVADTERPRELDSG